MFLDNKYTKWYYKLIQKSRKTEKTGYTEKHHVIPKSLGGDSSEDNVVNLPARAHFIAHKLLVKMTQGLDKVKMSYAYHCFLRLNPNNSGRLALRVSSREYSHLRQLLSEAARLIHTGKKVSAETIAKRSATVKLNNKPYPDSARKLHSDHSKEQWKVNRDKRVLAARSPERNSKISAANKGKNRLPYEVRSRLTAGVKNGMARKIIITSPNGEKYFSHGNFHNTCKSLNLPFCTMNHILAKTRTFKSGATVGWNAEYYD